MVLVFMKQSDSWNTDFNHASLLFRLCNWLGGFTRYLVRVQSSFKT